MQRHSKPPRNSFSGKDHLFLLKQARKSVLIQQKQAASWRRHDLKPTKVNRDIKPHLLHKEAKFSHLLLPMLFQPFSYNSRTQILLMLFLLLQTISSTNSMRTIHSMENEDVNADQLLCKSVSLGTSGVLKCFFTDGFTYYLKEKQFSPTDSNPSCREEYFRQFVKNNIGINVPPTRFFSIKAVHPFEQRFFISSKEASNLVMASSFKDHPEARMLALNDIAKLIVAMSFINDLHYNNWGVDRDGLVLIDVDGYTGCNTLADYLELGLKIREHLNNAGFGALSLNNVIEAKNIYIKMLKQGLPPHQHAIDFTDQMYRVLLNKYISLCSNVINMTRSVCPPSKPSIQHTRIFQLLMQAYADLAPTEKRVCSPQFKQR